MDFFFPNAKEASFIAILPEKSWVSSEERSDNNFAIWVSLSTLNECASIFLPPYILLPFQDDFIDLPILMLQSNRICPINVSTLEPF